MDLTETLPSTHAEQQLLKAVAEAIRDLLGGTLAVSGPLTDAQLGARLLATAAGQTTANGLLTSIKTSLEASVDLAATLWTDDSGAFYVQRQIIDQDAGTITVSFTTPTGAAATPGSGLRPAANEESLTPITQLYNVGTTNAPGGYTLGDVVARHVVMNENTAPPSVVAATWLNLTTGAVIAAPTAAHIILAESAASTGAATDAKLELVRLLLAGSLSAVAPPPTSGTVTIALGASLSDALQVDGKLSGIVIPNAWDTAAVTFLGSADGAAYFPIYDAGVERSIASASVAVNRMILLSLADWLGVKFVKIRSGTAAAVVPQTAARTLTLLKVA